MATNGDREAGGCGRGQVGDRNPPTTPVSKESGTDGGNNSMARRPMMAAPPRPRDLAADDYSAGGLPRQSDGANGADHARPENGMHPHRKYGLLAL